MHHFRYLFSAIAIIAGIILILCGMNFYRALYLIIFGVLFIPFKLSDLLNKETPKGAKFWVRKILVSILALLTALSLCNFLTATRTDANHSRLYENHMSILVDKDVSLSVKTIPSR